MGDEPKVFWTPVIQAYEESIEALEAARNDYTEATRKLLKGIDGGLNEQRLEIPEGSVLSRESPGHGVGDRPGAAELQINITNSGGVKVQLCFWFPGPWGNTKAALRVGVYLDDPPAHLIGGNMPDALDMVHSVVDASLPGSAYCAEEHGEDCDDEAGNRQWLRIATIGLEEQAFGAIVHESIETGIALVRGAGLPAAKLLEEYLQPVRLAHDGLVACREPLLAAAKQHGLSVEPQGKDLGTWVGNHYLQIEDDQNKFWVSVDPNRRRVIASSHPDGFVQSLAEQLGVPRETVNSFATIGLSGGDELCGLEYPSYYLELFESFIRWRTEERSSQEAR